MLMGPRYSILVAIFFLISISFLYSIYLFFNSSRYNNPTNIQLNCSPDFCPNLYRPRFPEHQPLSDYLKGEQPVPRGDTPWPEVYEPQSIKVNLALNEQRSRLFVVRIIGNDLWPIVSPCRSRLNLVRLLKQTLIPESIKIIGNNISNWINEEKELNGLVGNSNIILSERYLNPLMSPIRTYSELLNVLELWAPYRILNGTEHRLILDVLGRHQKRNLVFSVPVDLPTLSLAKSYMGYLTNIALARQVLLRETNSLGARWTLLISSNYYVSDEAWKSLSCAIESAENNMMEFILVPTFKLINTSDGYDILNPTISIKDLSTKKVIRLPPQLLVRYSAPINAFSSNLGIWGTQSWIKALEQLIKENISLVACVASFSESLNNGQSVKSESSLNLPAQELSTQEILLAKHCGYVVELENFPDDRDNDCFIDAPVGMGGKKVSEVLSLTDHNLREKYMRLAAEVFQKFIEMSLVGQPH